MNIKKKAILLSSIICSLIILCIAWILIANFTAKRGNIACIYKDGELIQEINLNDYDKEYTFVITDNDGGTNTICVTNKKIGISHANCPDKLCVKMGYIDNSLIPITCLPNHIIIEIKSSEDSTLDAISH